MAARSPYLRSGEASILGAAGEQVSRTYPIGYNPHMGVALLERARQEAGLSQDELASRAGTSRTTVSAYEHGRKSPTLATVERLLASAGFELAVEPHVTFSEVEMRRGRPIFVADRLWRLPIKEALATVTLPLGLNWSRPGFAFALGDRRQRARCYEIVLREGMPADILRFVDGALLVDLWADLVIPRDVRGAWQPIVDGVSS
jgi:transcriptional regulator with XRE-family HTH domain